MLSQTNISNPDPGDLAYNTIRGGAYTAHTATFKIAAGASTPDGDMELEISYMAPTKIQDTINLSGINMTPELETCAVGGFWNGYLGFELPDALRRLRPIIGGGIGGAVIREHGTVRLNNRNHRPKSTIKSAKTHVQFAWNVGGGAQFKISDHMFIECMYRYTDMGKIKKVADIDKLSRRLYAHEMLFGARYVF